MVENGMVLTLRESAKSMRSEMERGNMGRLVSVGDEGVLEWQSQKTGASRG